MDTFDLLKPRGVQYWGQAVGRGGKEFVGRRPGSNSGSNSVSSDGFLHSLKLTTW